MHVSMVVLPFTHAYCIMQINRDTFPFTHNIVCLQKQQENTATFISVSQNIKKYLSGRKGWVVLMCSVCQEYMHAISSSFGGYAC